MINPSKARVNSDSAGTTPVPPKDLIVKGFMLFEVYKLPVWLPVSPNLTFSDLWAWGTGLASFSLYLERLTGFQIRPFTASMSSHMLLLFIIPPSFRMAEMPPKTGLNSSPSLFHFSYIQFLFNVRFELLYVSNCKN